MGEVTKNLGPYFKIATPRFMLFEVFYSSTSIIFAWTIIDFGTV